MGDGGNRRLRNLGLPHAWEFLTQLLCLGGKENPVSRLGVWLRLGKRSMRFDCTDISLEI